MKENGLSKGNVFTKFRRNQILLAVLLPELVEMDQVSFLLIRVSQNVDKKLKITPGLL